MDARTRAAASVFLVKAFAEVRRRRIVPRLVPDTPWERANGPWPPYWPCWEIARSDIATPLLDVLRENYPERLGDVTEYPFRDARQYVTALLRAAIAHNLSLAVTTTYLRRLEGVEDHSWERVAASIGV